MTNDKTVEAVAEESQNPEYINMETYKFRIIKEGKRSTDAITLEYDSFSSPVGCSVNIAPVLAKIIQDLVTDSKKTIELKKHIKVLVECLGLVMKNSTNFRLKAPNYMVDKIEQALSSLPEELRGL